MRPGQEAPDDPQRFRLSLLPFLASMRPGQEAPDDPSVYRPLTPSGSSAQFASGSDFSVIQAPH